MTTRDIPDDISAEGAAAGPSTSVAVVIPSYGGASTIKRAVESVLAQKNVDVFVSVVIDDGCELTRSNVEEIGDGRVTVLTNASNMGAPASRNRGLALADSPYVLFLDADDYLEGDFLAPLATKMEEEDADVGFGPSVTWSPRRGYYNHRLPNYASREQLFFEWLGLRKNVNTASVLWSADYLRRIGSWDEQVRRNQDSELTMRAILMGARFTTSQEGAGVWSHDPALGRITTRTDNLGSLLYVVEKLRAIPSNAIPDQLRRDVFARYYLTIAHLAFSAGQDEVGRAALEQRRATGVSGFSGNWRYGLSSSLRVIPRKQRLLIWQVAKLVRRLLRRLA